MDFRPIEFRPKSLVDHQSDMLATIAQKIKTATTQHDEPHTDKEYWLSVLERLYQWHNEIQAMNIARRTPAKRRVGRPRKAA